MPIYEYEREDGTRFEHLQKISEKPLTTCPTTGQAVKRLISTSAFHLKGGGWYKTDYASNGSQPIKKADSEKKEKTDSPQPEKSESSSPSKSPDSLKATGGCGAGCACADKSKSDS